MDNPKLNAIHEETATPVSAKVSPSLHPQSLIPHGGPLLEHESPLAEGAYRSGRSAMKGLYSTLLDMEAAVEAVTMPTNVASQPGHTFLKNEVPPARRQELHSLLTTAFERTARNFDAHYQSIQEAVSTLEKRVAAPLEDPKRNEAAAQHVASEIREILRQYSPEQRMPAAIHNAILDGDISVIRACVNATPFAVGITAKDQELIRQMAGAKFAPVEMAQLTHARAVAAKALKASELFVARFQKLLPDVKANPREAALAKLRTA